MDRVLARLPEARHTLQPKAAELPADALPDYVLKNLQPGVAVAGQLLHYLHIDVLGHLHICRDIEDLV